MEARVSHLPTPKPGDGTLPWATSRLDFAYGAVTLYGSPFQVNSAIQTPEAGLPLTQGQKHHISASSSLADLVWAVPLSVAPTQGISIDFSSSPY